MKKKPRKATRSAARTRSTGADRQASINRTGNRTGIAHSAAEGRALVQAARASEPTSDGAGDGISELRRSYAEEAEPIGSMAARSGRTKGKTLRGASATVLLDKLGERVAFERAGARLYQALIDRFESFGEIEGGPTLYDLRRLLGEEAGHFELLSRCVRELGGDPTVLTPGADVSAVVSTGIPQVLSDPSTSPAQCLQAMLVAELADHDGWELLVELAKAMGLDRMATEFEEALEREQDHLRHVRDWVAALTFIEAGLRVRPAYGDDGLRTLEEEQLRFQVLLARVRRGAGGEPEELSAAMRRLQDAGEALSSF